MQRLAPLTSSCHDHPLHFESVLEQYQKDGPVRELSLMYCSAHVKKSEEAMEQGDLKLYEHLLATAITLVDVDNELDVQCELYLKLTLFYLQQTNRDRFEEAHCLLLHAISVHRKYRDVFHSPDSGCDFLDSSRPASFVEQLHMFALQVWGLLRQQGRLVVREYLGDNCKFYQNVYLYPEGAFMTSEERAKVKRSREQQESALQAQMHKHNGLAGWRSATQSSFDDWGGPGGTIREHGAEDEGSQEVKHSSSTARASGLTKREEQQIHCSFATRSDFIRCVSTYIASMVATGGLDEAESELAHNLLNVETDHASMNPHAVFVPPAQVYFSIGLLHVMRSDFRAARGQFNAVLQLIQSRRVLLSGALAGPSDHSSETVQEDNGATAAPVLLQEVLPEVHALMWLGRVDIQMRKDASAVFQQCVQKLLSIDGVGPAPEENSRHDFTGRG